MFSIHGDQKTTRLRYVCFALSLNLFLFDAFTARCQSMKNTDESANVDDADICATRKINRRYNECWHIFRLNQRYETIIRLVYFITCVPHSHKPTTTAFLFIFGLAFVPCFILYFKYMALCVTHLHICQTEGNFWKSYAKMYLRLHQMARKLN